LESFNTTANSHTVESKDDQDAPSQHDIQSQPRKRKLSSDYLTLSKHFQPSSVNTRFCDVTDQLQHILLSCNTISILEKCESLMASETNGIALFSKNHLHKLKESKFPATIFQNLRPYFSWSDHSVLSALVQACNIANAAKLLDQFESKVNLTLPITDYPIPKPTLNMLPYENSTHTVLAVKLQVELSNVSLQNVIDVRQLLQEKFQITSYCFQLLAAKGSSAILYWTIPKCIISVITSNITQHSTFLHRKGIVEVSVYPGLLFVIAGCLQVGSFSFFTQLNELVRKGYTCIQDKIVCLTLYSHLIVTKR